MRIVLLATAALTVSSAMALAAPMSTAGLTDIDYYSFAGGRDAVVAAPLQTGRSAAAETPKAFTAGDVNHAFAPRGFAD